MSINLVLPQIQNTELVRARVLAEQALPDACVIYSRVYDGLTPFVTAGGKYLFHVEVFDDTVQAFGVKGVARCSIQNGVSQYTPETNPPFTTRYQCFVSGKVVLPQDLFMVQVMVWNGEAWEALQVMYTSTTYVRPGANFIYHSLDLTTKEPTHT